MIAMDDKATVGILCLQGDYEAHAQVLARLGARWRAVRRAAELDGLCGLLLPGGESTTMWHFLRQDDFESALRRFAARGAALFGTCAGAILLAREVRNPESAGLGCLDITIERNAYGRQTESRVGQATLADVTGLDGGASRGQPVEAVLIRAPRILRVGPGVRVRARLGDDPVWVESGPVMATTFHPELGSELRPHHRFLQLCAAVAGDGAGTLPAK
jgi:pyridoxal 5'-phosphate synthase pdxT subunit